MGRISLIKMNVPPRLLYPQMLPLYITKKTNEDLEKALSKCIWHGKKPRQKLKKLQLPINLGGLFVPNLHILRERLVLNPGHASPWSLVTCDACKINPEVKSLYYIQQCQGMAWFN